MAFDPIDCSRVGHAWPAYTHTSKPNPKLKSMLNNSTLPNSYNGLAPLNPWVNKAINTTSSVLMAAMPANRIWR
ncbi:hypothetical protein DIJ64_03755 [Mycobacterium leprae]|uniref:Uncharacterized protein n=1 Tax=Mycobacterium leprae TaxID=1769 RepID=A0AAD0KT78_MYCLR|nr:hypothetical protein DIJ64_03755 [Mycobacterium leprae]OAR21716.1 hypothetical protein A8144_00450 [Mycobacterium leprae 3125609]OAX72255.1 hypothetical protein A3216_00515 [Mycobacterium leprae 7935681]